MSYHSAGRCVMSPLEWRLAERVIVADAAAVAALWPPATCHKVGEDQAVYCADRPGEEAVARLLAVAEQR